MALLVEGISILIKKSILKSEIYYAENRLMKFVEEIPELYDISHVSFNAHLLTHLSSSVYKWEPLWTHSAFLYENYNQEMLQFIHSSQHVVIQVCKTYIMQPVVYNLNQIEIYGVPKSGKLSREHYLAFQRMNIDVEDKSCVSYYDKILVENKVVQSMAYTKVKKRNNYSVQLKNGQIFEIQKFIVISVHNIPQCYAIGQYFIKKSSYCK